LDDWFGFFHPFVETWGGPKKKQKKEKEKDPVTTPCLRAYFAGGRVSN
jgi:hypothetical protein